MIRRIGQSAAQRRPRPHAAALRGMALGVVALALALSLAGPLAPPRAAQAAPLALEDYEAGPYALGGDFTLTSHTGKQATLQQYRGKVVLVFFGYTYCPDVCPLTLTEMARMNKLLGPATAAKVQPLFVTVDPARDTPARLKSYLGNFAPGIVGLTGSEAEIRAVATRYQARFARGSADAKPGQYLMDHTGYVYMLDGTGKVRYLFTHDAGGELFAQGARKLLGG